MCKAVQGLQEKQGKRQPIVIDDIPTNTGFDTRLQDATLKKLPVIQSDQGLEMHCTQIQLQGHYQDPQS